MTLCRTEKIDAWVRKASKVGVPFYVALPTYGYRVAFDERGAFAALAGEGVLPAWGEGWQVRLARADPDELAPVVRRLRESPPQNFIGIAWFRLPVETDELNWSWPALEAVRAGRAPTVRFEADVRTPAPDLFEVWVRNAGERNALQPLRVHVKCPAPQVVAYDLLGGFREEGDQSQDAWRLVGPAPRLESPVMAAWFRLRPTADAPESTLCVTRVEVMK